MTASSRKKILVVDDEPDLLELLNYNVSKEGFDVSTSGDGEDALEKAKTGKFDLMILDLMLPGLSGTEICRILRGNPSTSGMPIIMLTAKSEEFDKIFGLEMGADDYITKPFSPREVVARIKAVLRRAGKAAEPQEKGPRLSVGNIEIDKETYSVTKKGEPVDLSATEYRLLLYLAERKGRVFSRNQLLDAVWRDEAFVEPRTVDVHIRRLRTQIEDDPANPSYVKTKRGIGYYFQGPE